MDYRHTIEIVSNNLVEIEKLIGGFQSHKNVPAIELDLVLAKVRDLYDVLLLMRQSIKTQDQDPTPSNEEKQISFEVEGPKTDIEEKEDNSDSPEFDETEPSQQQGSKIPETAPNPASQKGPEILSDRFKSRNSSLNENLGRDSAKGDLSSKLSKKPIASISGAIGLNDKFLIINELFGGNTDKYNDTLQLLNQSASFNDAYNYLMENFDWDMDSELVQLILDLIRRKLIINKNE